MLIVDKNELGLIGGGEDENNCFCGGITFGYRFPDRGECEKKCCDDWPPKKEYEYEGEHWDCP